MASQAELDYYGQGDQPDSGGWFGDMFSGLGDDIASMVNSVSGALPALAQGAQAFGLIQTEQERIAEAQNKVLLKSSENQKTGAIATASSVAKIGGFAVAGIALIVIVTIVLKKR